MSRVSADTEQQHQESDTQPLPALSMIEPAVDRVIEIARDQLADPITVKLWTWEDGEFKVRVEHSYPRGSDDIIVHDTVIQYHSRREIVTGFLLEENRETGEETLLLREELETLPDPREK